MSARSLIMSAAGNAGDKLYVDDVFSAYTYTGTGATQTINNGIDLAGKGGMVWVKRRDSGEYPKLLDSARTNSYMLSSAATSAEQNLGVVNLLSNGFNFPGFTGDCNTSSGSYVSWTFRKAPKFFLNTTVTKSSGSNATVDLSSLGTVGMVMVKRTDAAGSWYVFHRSATAGKLLFLEQTAAEATLGHITLTGTTLTLVNGVIADGSYVVYAWAHDSSVDGIVQCGSFTSDGGGNATVNLGWEPQYVLMKRASGGTSSWYLLDTARGLPVGSSDNYLFADQSMAEGSLDVLALAATGFSALSAGASMTWTYMAIRRSNKPPTVGTQVYNAIARTGTSAAATVTGVGFAPDLCITKKRSSTTLTGARFADRLRGKTIHLDSTATSPEVTTADTVTGFDVMDGFVLGVDATTTAFNTSGHTYVNHFFKRAPGVLDMVCYTGSGVARTVTHGLGVIPELIIVKNRGVAVSWVVFNSTLTATKYVFLNGTNAEAAASDTWNNTEPSNSVFSVGTAQSTNQAANTYIAYLFATKAGISKVGSYTGNGTSQTLDMGFTTGARFFMVKRTDAAGDWMIFDVARGIIAGSDPHLSLNTTAAEVTTDDSVDPASVGLIVNQLAATNLNVTSATYIYLSFA